MCWDVPSSSFSRVGLLLGLACIVVNVLSILAGAWVVTREPLRQRAADADSEEDAGIYVSTRIGLLRTCARLDRINASAYAYHLNQQPPCTVPPLNPWREVVTSDLGINGNLVMTPQIVTKLRQSVLVLTVVALSLVALGELVACVAHCKGSFKPGIVLACYLFVLAGLVQCLAVVMVPTLTEVPHRVDVSMRVPVHKLAEPFSWEYGLSYYLGVTVFVLTQTLAAVMVTAFVKRFSTMEVMVREVVPGADRKLREHQENNLVGLWEIYPSRTARQLGCINLPGAATCYGKVPEPVVASKSKPDICSSNPDSSVDSLQQHAEAHDDEVEPAQDSMPPLSPFDRNLSVSLGQPMSLTAAPASGAPIAQVPAAATASVATPGPGGPLPPGADAQDANLAGVSVPITVMRGRPLGQQHRTIPCGVVLDDPAALAYGAPGTGGPLLDGTMTVARRKCSGPGVGPAATLALPQGSPCPPCVQGQACSTMDSRRCNKGLMHAHAHTHTLPHPPRQF